MSPVDFISTGAGPLKEVKIGPKRIPETSSPVAIFDLDYTLIEGDSEYLWSHFLFEKGVVTLEFLTRIENYYRDYEQGQLDMVAYEEFFLQPLTILPLEMLHQLREEFLERIQLIVRPIMLERVEWHRAHGFTLLMLSASNSFVVEPIAGLFDFPHLICTQVEEDGQHMTGRITGLPAYRAGKIERLENWLHHQGLGLIGSFGYSDSHNDIPFLEIVDFPVAVTPDDILRAHALQRGWKIIPIA